MKDDILITNGLILPLDDGQPDTIEPGFVRIRQGKITALGPMADLSSPTEADMIIDAVGNLIMPGLVNAHSHAAMTLFRGLADDLPLMTWLNEHIFPAEARSVNPEMVYWCSKLAAAEMILSGTTTVADSYFFEEQAAFAFLDAGTRAITAQGVIDFPAPGVSDPAENVAVAENFINDWQGRSDLITPAVFCHSPYTCSPKTLQKAKAMARRKGVTIFIHVAETRAEVEQIKEQYKATPIGHLNSLGILDKNTVCVHCNWLSAEDIAIMAARGASIACCPKSNMKLAAGIAPLERFLAEKIPTGLGTDGCASNNTLDLFSELRLCAALHKDKIPTDLSESQLVRAVTSGAAEALGLKKSIGSLKPGKCADLIIIDLNRPWSQTFHFPETLVHSTGSRDVLTSIINGRLVMDNRKILTFDVKETMEQVRALSKNISKSV